MKKSLFILMWSVAIPFVLTAQDFKYGVKAGLNINNLSVTPELDPPAPSSRIGFHLGGFTQFGVSDQLLIQPELVISTQGANDEDPDVEQNVKLTYLNLSGIAKYQIGNAISIFAGPQFGFLMDGEFEEVDKVDGAQEIFAADAVYKSTDFSFTLGAGYTLDSGIQIDIRYNLGLSDNNDDPLETAFYDRTQEVKSRTFQISVGYILN
ncbi:MAG: porin family protein [Fulvivirga sp.]